MVQIQPAVINDQILSLLKVNNLPVTDLETRNPGIILFTAGGTQMPVGAVGLEMFKKRALLRSLAVDKQHRNAGIGKQLVQYAEEYAAGKSVREIYLLTDTASAFFARLGYSEVSRENVPGEIRRSDQFSSICPTSATVMKKRL